MHPRQQSAPRHLTEKKTTNSISTTTTTTTTTTTRNSRAAIRLYTSVLVILVLGGV
jgi:hypothetical protein